MSDQSNDDKSGADEMYFFGAIVVSICVGTLYEQVHGWLCLGLLLLVGAIIGRKM